VKVARDFRCKLSKSVLLDTKFLTVQFGIYKDIQSPR